jgi:hypothetical protein
MKNFTPEEYFILFILVIFIGLILFGRTDAKTCTFKEEKKCIGHFMFKIHSDGYAQQLLTPDSKGIECE